MSKKNIYIAGCKELDQLYEQRKLENVITKEKNKKTDEFILESRIKILEGYLKKTKSGREFNEILNECVDLIMEAKEIPKESKDTVLRLVKDKIIDQEIIGKFDNKNQKQIKDAWPGTGRKTLRDVIDKKYLGQNNEVGQSDNLKKSFIGSSNKEQPSPSNGLITETI